MFLIRWLINALAIYAIAELYSGLSITSFYTALLIVIIFGLVNAVIGNILKLLTLPINILTLGVGCLFINGLMLWLTSSIIKGMELSGFWAAFLVALIYSIITFFTGWLLKRGKEY
ncbi:hypothetical protein A2533_02215 [Candidatus Falkowbacteria bacterium RIFOXYD2_FULL_35_9]|uniref:Phage holin family protein n=1 Tax=Candidatus Falkowbacteria bacterium RIFOXYC2_FULL_36_12 TaxID=1798002 RepID=A0A1F5SZV2_9BACT|nr:MAG: hypothetical protein A2478_02825 [Candidatus Falkowbacteria bacterium RIFOXYC2_FULL_36_12]OGF34162.1 MAG: hypothetical protein A2223_01355 [Candidatus Falkowbacteria bacterium RIFOXYA2_FULL_35_8]OGF48320.1 MAG: hypothetical protein A2533_02215 [Candidatus Falkowbacteria bacterium RIFOXYD2_FULL_35_9]